MDSNKDCPGRVVRYCGRIPLGTLIGIVAGSAVRHSHKDSKRYFNKGSSEGCEAFS